MSGINVDFTIKNQKGTPAFYSDIFANRPTYGYPGRVFISTDTGAIYEDTGSAWTLIADAGAGSSNTLEVVTTNGNTTTQGIVISAGNLAIGTATAGAPLDIHTTTGTAAQFNGTGVNNAYAFFQNAGVSKWRIGNYYNGGTNQFTIYNNAAAVTQLVMDSGATTLIGNFTATTLIKSGGTSAQFLKADGSVDSSTYITTNSSQTIAAGITKTWNNEMRFGLGTMYDNSTGVSLATGFTTINAGLTGSNTFLQVWRSNAYKLTFNCDLTSAGSTFTLPAGQSNALIATATGTSSQLIAGDGTLISAGTNITISGGTISSSGGGGSIAIGSTITSATAGSVLYAGASGVLAQSNSNFYYDYTNNRLGIGTTVPLSPLHVSGSMRTVLNSLAGGDTLFSAINGVSNGYRIQVDTSNNITYTWNTGASVICMTINSTGNLGLGTSTIGSKFQVNGSTALGYNTSTGAPSNGLVVSGNTIIGGTTDAGYKLDVQGTFRVSGASTFSSTITASTLTSGSILFAGASGVLSQDNTNFFWDNTNKRLGIGTATPATSLDITGNARFGGVIITGNPTIPSGTASALVEGYYGAGGYAYFQGYNYTALTYIPVYVDGSALYLNASSTPHGTAYVGIGTTTLGSKLQVNGNTAIGYNSSTGAPSNGLAVSGTTLLGTSTDNGQGVLQVSGGITGGGISLTGEVLSATATLNKAYYHVFTGSTGQTLTLPSPSSNNYIYVIINNTANAVTIAAATSTNIITTTNTSVASFTLIANARTEIIADGNNKYYQIY
jgi:hypothetical protein